MHIELEGFSELEAVLKKMPSRVARKPQMKAFRKGGRILVKEMRSRAPISTKVPFESIHRNYSKGKASVKSVTHKKGELRRAIKTKMKTNNGMVTMWVGPISGAGEKNDAWYAHFVEFGTAGFTPKRGPYKGKFVSGQSPQPFVRPAFDQKKDEVADIVMDELWKEIRKGWAS